MYIYHLFTIYHQMLKFYTKSSQNIFVINSCHVTIPCTYGWVRSECKCSGNHGADGLAPPILVAVVNIHIHLVVHHHTSVVT